VANKKIVEKQLATKNYINKSESTISQHVASGNAHFYQHFVCVLNMNVGVARPTD